jgi:hypothetical protein
LRERLNFFEDSFLRGTTSLLLFLQGVAVQDFGQVRFPIAAWITGFYWREGWAAVLSSRPVKFTMESAFHLKFCTETIQVTFPQTLRQ